MSDFFYVILAELLRKDNHGRFGEENRYLFKKRHSGKRRNHLRLQIPSRGRKDSMPLRN